MKHIKDIYTELPDIAGYHVSYKTQQTGDGERHIIGYVDIPLSFDIEAYSFKDPGGDPVKRAVMWAWGFSIEDTCYLGRTWDEFTELLEYLVHAWGLNLDHRVIIWVHNLAYDFQFFRKWVQWVQVFSLKPRTVCYAVSCDGIEFRCSYQLTGYSLAQVGEHLLSHKVKKLVGEIDYDIPRHPGTLLTDKEVEYLENDCLIVTAHIREQIDIEGGLSGIPLTKTGYVRRYVRKACFRDTTKKRKEDFSAYNYRNYMSNLYLDGFIYDSLKMAFQGGYTHANPYYVEDVVKDVHSIDYTSKYPEVICSRVFPVSSPEYVSSFKDESEFIDTLKRYACVFTVTFYELKAVFNEDHYISRSRCHIDPGVITQESNGRIVHCEKLTTVITNLDFFIIRKTYSYKSYTVSGFIRWAWGYLPKAIINSVLYFYEQKTQLKGVPGREGDYLLFKEMLNSNYGMMVQDPLRPEIPYSMDDNEWGIDVGGGERRYHIEGDKLESLGKYNQNPRRFTYYAWGVFVTAWARFDLWEGILEMGHDYVYSDTDSLKFKNLEKHKPYIEDYDKRVQARIRACLTTLGIDPDRASPRNERGDPKPLGVWTYEGKYSRFKSLGAKRYMTEENGKISITVSGVNKKDAVPYILEQGGDPFDFFNRDMVIPPGHAGKMIPYYGDNEIAGIVTDRDGVPYTYRELSYVYMEPGGYSLSLSDKYIMYLDMLRKGML